MTTTPQSSVSPGVAATPDRFLTASNLLSISRAFLVIPFVVAMLYTDPPSRLWGCVIMILAALTDRYDGILARKLNQVTDWGKILDPIADKIDVGAVAIVLLILGNIPLWFVIVLIARDVLIASGGIYVKKKKGLLLQSNEAGKWTVGIVALALFLMVLNAQTILVETAVWTSVTLLIVSFALYVRRFIEVMKE